MKVSNFERLGGQKPQQENADGEGFLYFRKLGVIIIYLIVLLFSLNTIMFLVYFLSHLGVDFFTQLWNYFNSKIFEYITIGLLIPIILLFIESRLNFIQTILNNRIERERRKKAEQRERIRKEKEEMKKRRLEGIEKTQELWNDLYDLISNVIHLNIKTEKMKIDYIKRRFARFISFNNDVMVIWEPRFNLPGEKKVNEIYWRTFRLFMEFVAIKYNIAEAVVYTIGDKKCKRVECNDLQKSLHNIQRGIEDLAYKKFIDILKNLIKLLELYEDNGDFRDKEKIQTTISKKLDDLDKRIKEIYRYESIDKVIVQSFKGKDAKAIEGMAKEFFSWKQKNPGVPKSQYPKYKIIRDFFLKNYHEEIAKSTPILHTTEYIRDLGDYFYFQRIYGVINYMEKWSK
jgi:hypothetical protein